jgi:hypothetical protein
MGSRFSAFALNCEHPAPSPLRAEGLHDPWASAPELFQPAKLPSYHSGDAVGQSNQRSDAASPHPARLLSNIGSVAIRRAPRSVDTARTEKCCCI